MSGTGLVSATSGTMTISPFMNVNDRLELRKKALLIAEEYTDRNGDHYGVHDKENRAAFGLVNTEVTTFEIVVEQTLKVASWLIGEDRDIKIREKEVTSRDDDRKDG